MNTGKLQCGFSVSFYFLLTTPRTMGKILSWVQIMKIVLSWSGPDPPFFLCFLNLQLSLILQILEFISLHLPSLQRHWLFDGSRLLMSSGKILSTWLQLAKVQSLSWMSFTYYTSFSSSKKPLFRLGHWRKLTEVRFSPAWVSSAED